MLISLRANLKRVSSPARAKVSQRFFKTGPGQYGEGDVFVGASVPEQRKIAIKYKQLNLIEIETLLKSKIHEERLIALFILVNKFKKGSEEEKKEIFNFYLKSTKYINNWDLVDSSAPYIVGEYLNFRHSELDSESLIKFQTEIPEQVRNDILSNLAQSKNLWDRRIAIISTFAYIKRGEYDLTFKTAEQLISDKHDLIQKAIGWMLREVGNKCGQEVEESFLKKHYKVMGRTALRYAIERFDESSRKKYLSGLI